MATIYYIFIILCIILLHFNIDLINFIESIINLNIIFKINNENKVIYYLIFLKIIIYIKLDINQLKFMLFI